MVTAAKRPAAKKAVPATKATPEAKEARNVRAGADKKFKVPKTLGACADRWFQLREERLGIAKQADGIKAEETFLKEHLISVLPKNDAVGVTGHIVSVKAVTKPVPQAKDWSAIYAHIVAEYGRLKKAGKDPDEAFAIMGRTLGADAIKQRWEAKLPVPGVERFNNVDISFSRV